MSVHAKRHSYAVLAYKESEYLEKCIESLLNQIIPSEIYVCTSTPNRYIEKIVKKYKLKLYINTGVRGIGGDWNFAISKCKTEFITLAHQDDIYLPDYTAECLASTEKAGNCQLVFTDYRELIADNTRDSFMLFVKRILLLPFHIKNSISSRSIKKSVFLFGSPVCCPSVFFKKNALGAFNTNYKINLDWDMWLRMATEKGRFNYCNKVLMLHRIHSGSETSKGIISDVRKNEDIEMFNKLWPKPLAVLIAKIYTISYKWSK